MAKKKAAKKKPKKKAAPTKKSAAKKDCPGQVVIPGCDRPFDIQLRMFARDCKLSQEGAAKVLGISRSAVSQLAWSDRRPSGAVAQCLKLARMILVMDLYTGRKAEDFCRRFLPLVKRTSWRSDKVTLVIDARWRDGTSIYERGWWVQKRTSWGERSSSKVLPS